MTALGLVSDINIENWKGIFPLIDWPYPGHTVLAPDQVYIDQNVIKWYYIVSEEEIILKENPIFSSRHSK